MIIKNARILTMESPEELLGWVQYKNGVITVIGKTGETMPDDVEVIDACGHYLMPGMIDIHTHLGMWEDSLGFEGADGNEATDPATPHLRAVDAINPRDRTFGEALAAGITTVLTGPGSANPIGGQFCAIKTYGKRIDNMVIKAPASMKFAFGENPKRCYNSKNQSPSTRMATAAIIRETLNKVKQYMEKKQAAEEKGSEPPAFDAKYEALIPVLKGDLPAHFHAHRADDIFTAIRIAREFNLNFTLIHCTDGHLISDELYKENVTVVSGPALSDRSKPELSNLTFETQIGRAHV